MFSGAASGTTCIRSASGTAFTVPSSVAAVGATLSLIAGAVVPDGNDPSGPPCGALGVLEAVVAAAPLPAAPSLSIVGPATMACFAKLSATTSVATVASSLTWALVQPATSATLSATAAGAANASVLSFSNGGLSDGEVVEFKATLCDAVGQCATANHVVTVNVQSAPPAVFATLTSQKHDLQTSFSLTIEVVLPCGWTAATPTVQWYVNGVLIARRRAAALAVRRRARAAATTTYTFSNSGITLPDGALSGPGPHTIEARLPDFPSAQTATITVEPLPDPPQVRLSTEGHGPTVLPGDAISMVAAVWDPSNTDPNSTSGSCSWAMACADAGGQSKGCPESATGPRNLAVSAAAAAASGLGNNDTVAVTVTCLGVSASATVSVFGGGGAPEPVPGGGLLENSRDDALEVPAMRPLTINLVLPQRELTMLSLGGTLTTSWSCTGVDAQYLAGAVRTLSLPAAAIVSESQIQCAVTYRLIPAGGVVSVGTFGGGFLGTPTHAVSVLQGPFGGTVSYLAETTNCPGDSIVASAREWVSVGGQLQYRFSVLSGVTQEEVFAKPFSSASSVSMPCEVFMPESGDSEDLVYKVEVRDSRGSAATAQTQGRLVAATLSSDEQAAALDALLPLPASASPATQMLAARSAAAVLKGVVGSGGGSDEGGTSKSSIRVSLRMSMRSEQVNASALRESLGVVLSGLLRSSSIKKPVLSTEADGGTGASFPVTGLQLSGRKSAPMEAGNTVSATVAEFVSQVTSAITADVGRGSSAVLAAFSVSSGNGKAVQNPSVKNLLSGAIGSLPPPQTPEEQLGAAGALKSLTGGNLGPVLTTLPVSQGSGLVAGQAVGVLVPGGTVEGGAVPIGPLPDGVGGSMMSALSAVSGDGQNGEAAEAAFDAVGDALEVLGFSMLAGAAVGEARSVTNNGATKTCVRMDASVSTDGLPANFTFDSLPSEGGSSPELCGTQWSGNAYGRTRTASNLTQIRFGKVSGSQGSVVAARDNTFSFVLNRGSFSPVPNADLLCANGSYQCGGGGPGDLVRVNGVWMEPATCTYWHTGMRSWRTDGCTSESSPDGSTVKCTCTHLTEFSVTSVKPTLNLPSFNLADIKFAAAALILVVFVTLVTAFVYAVRWERRRDAAFDADLTAAAASSRRAGLPPPCQRGAAAHEKESCVPDGHRKVLTDIGTTRARTAGLGDGRHKLAVVWGHRAYVKQTVVEQHPWLAPFHTKPRANFGAARAVAGLSTIVMGGLMVNAFYFTPAEEEENQVQVYITVATAVVTMVVWGMLMVHTLIAMFRGGPTLHAHHRTQPFLTLPRGRALGASVVSPATSPVRLRLPLGGDQFTSAAQQAAASPAASPARKQPVSVGSPRSKVYVSSRLGSPAAEGGAVTFPLGFSGVPLEVVEQGMPGGPAPSEDDHVSVTWLAGPDDEGPVLPAAAGVALGLSPGPSPALEPVQQSPQYDRVELEREYYGSPQRANPTSRLVVPVYSPDCLLPPPQPLLAPCQASSPGSATPPVPMELPTVVAELVPPEFAGAPAHLNGPRPVVGQPAPAEPFADAECGLPPPRPPIDLPAGDSAPSAPKESTTESSGGHCAELMKAIALESDSGSCNPSHELSSGGSDPNPLLPLQPQVTGNARERLQATRLRTLTQGLTPIRKISSRLAPRRCSYVGVADELPSYPKPLRDTTRLQRIPEAMQALLQVFQLTAPMLGDPPDPCGAEAAGVAAALVSALCGAALVASKQRDAALHPRTAMVEAVRDDLNLWRHGVCDAGVDQDCVDLLGEVNDRARAAMKEEVDETIDAEMLAVAIEGEHELGRTLTTLGLCVLAKLEQVPLPLLRDPPPQSRTEGLASRARTVSALDDDAPEGLVTVAGIIRELFEDEHVRATVMGRADREATSACWMLGRELVAMRRLSSAAAIFEVSLLLFNPDLAHVLYPAAAHQELLATVEAACRSPRIGAVFVHHYLSVSLTCDELNTLEQLGPDWSSLLYDAQLRRQTVGERVLLAMELLGIADSHPPQPAFGGSSYLLRLESSTPSDFAEFTRLVREGRLLEAAHAARHVPKCASMSFSMEESEYPHASRVLSRYFEGFRSSEATLPDLPYSARTDLEGVLRWPCEFSECCRKARRWWQRKKPEVSPDWRTTLEFGKLFALVAAERLGADTTTALCRLLHDDVQAIGHRHLQHLSSGPRGMDTPEFFGELAPGYLAEIDSQYTLPSNNFLPTEAFVPNAELASLINQRLGHSGRRYCVSEEVPVKRTCYRSAAVLNRLPARCLGRFLVPQGGTGTHTNPHKGLSPALALVRVGERVCMMGGEYLGAAVEELYGTPQLPVLVEPVRGAGVRVRSIVEGKPAITLRYCRYVMLRGLTVVGNGGVGLDSTSSPVCGPLGCRFQHCSPPFQLSTDATDAEGAFVAGENGADAEEVNRCSIKRLPMQFTYAAYAYWVVAFLGTTMMTLFITAGYTDAMAQEWAVRTFLSLGLDGLVIKPLMLAATTAGALAFHLTSGDWQSIDTTGAGFDVGL